MSTEFCDESIAGSYGRGASGIIHACASVMVKQRYLTFAIGKNGSDQSDGLLQSRNLVFLESLLTLMSEKE